MNQPVSPPKLPNLEQRATAIREQEVTAITMKIRGEVGNQYKQIIWSVIGRDSVSRMQIAQALGVTDRVINNWERGQSAPRIPEQCVLLGLDSGMLVIMVLPDRDGRQRAVLAPGPAWVSGGSAPQQNQQQKPQDQK